MCYTSVAILASNFNGIVKLAIEFAVAMIVLLKMAVDAMHAFFGMDVLQEYGFGCRLASIITIPVIARNLNRAVILMA